MKPEPREIWIFDKHACMNRKWPNPKYVEPADAQGDLDGWRFAGRILKYTAIICAIGVVIWFGAIAFGVHGTAQIGTVTP